MKTRSAYGLEVTSRARRVVGDIFAALGNRAEHAVLIGEGRRKSPGSFSRTPRIRK